MDNFSITFIWAFSEQWFYGIMKNKESNNSTSFIEFVTKVFQADLKAKQLTISSQFPCVIMQTFIKQEIDSNL